MRRNVTLQEKFKMLKFDVGPNNNQFAAIRNLAPAIAAVHSRRSGAAFAAPAHTGQKRADKRTSKRLWQLGMHAVTTQEIGARRDSVDQ
jgi:hypothetical protein